MFEGGGTRTTIPSVVVDPPLASEVLDENDAIWGGGQLQHWKSGWGVNYSIGNLCGDSLIHSLKEMEGLAGN